jgi:hypothetical protein
MNSSLINELNVLTEKIEQNTAALEDYKRYEVILLNGGFRRDYIFSYLNRIGLQTWEDFVAIRQKNKKDLDHASAIGGIIGMGWGLILINIIPVKKIDCDE